MMSQRRNPIVAIVSKDARRHPSISLHPQHPRVNPLAQLVARQGVWADSMQDAAFRYCVAAIRD